MNNVITRLRERTRIAVGSTVAVLVSLPLGAAVGLAARSVGMEAPDQLALEHLMGVR